MNTAPTNIKKRSANERGQANHGWLNARFSFSFAEYVDPNHMGFHSLRVMNNDTIQPIGGFPFHPHRDMEIFTYVIEGQLEHRDSMGNGAILEAGNLQYMSAGSGVRHSEFNPSQSEPTHLYQVWILPNEEGGEPRYVEKPLRGRVPPNKLHLLFSGDGRDDSTAIRQEADIYFGQIKSDTTVTLPASEVAPHVWIQVVKGEVSILDERLVTGDGLALEDASGELAMTFAEETHILVFRLA